MSPTVYREWADPDRTPTVRCWWEQHLPADGTDHIQRVIPDGRAGKLQQPDGGWPIDWAVSSPAAALEWRGYVTVRALRHLHRNGLLT